MINETGPSFTYTETFLRDFKRIIFSDNILQRQDYLIALKDKYNDNNSILVFQPFYCMCIVP